MEHSLAKGREYFLNQLDALEGICKTDGSPWVFVCASAFISYLAKLGYGNDSGPQYQKFIEGYMPRKYRSFKYLSGDRDLPLQMWHVLRCGIVHSFTPRPNAEGLANRGRVNSIVLTHKEAHLEARYVSDRAPNTCVFRADEFVKDLKIATENLFACAARHSGFAKVLLERLDRCPPVGYDPSQIISPPV